jgi:hypothetical protein
VPPVTTPAASIAAIKGFELDHTPPAVALDKVVVPPDAHNTEIPVIAEGSGSTVTKLVAIHPVDNL